MHALVVGRGLRRELGEMAGEAQVAGGGTHGAFGQARGATREVGELGGERGAGAGFRCDGLPSYQPPYRRQMLRTTNSGSS